MSFRRFSLKARRKDGPRFQLAAPPGGQFLVAGGPHGVLHVLDPTTGQEIRRLEFSPGRRCWFWLVQGGRALLVRTDGGFQLLDPLTGEAIELTALDHLEDFRAITQDLTAMAIGSPVARVDLRTGARGGAVASHGEWVRYESDWESVQEVPILTVSFSPAGDWLATGGYDGSVLLWRAHEGGFSKIHEYTVPESPLVKQLHTERKQDLCPASSLTFSPDGRRLAVGSRDRVLLFATPGNGATEAPLLEVAADAHEASELEFSPDGQQFICNDTTIQAWETATGRYLGRARERPRADAMTLLPGDQLASVHEDGNLLVGPANWDASAAK